MPMGSWGSLAGTELASAMEAHDASSYGGLSIKFGSMRAQEMLIDYSNPGQTRTSSTSTTLTTSTLTATTTTTNLPGMLGGDNGPAKAASGSGVIMALLMALFVIALCACSTGCIRRYRKVKKEERNNKELLMEGPQPNSPTGMSLSKTESAMSRRGLSKTESALSFSGRDRSPSRGSSYHESVRSYSYPEGSETGSNAHSVRAKAMQSPSHSRAGSHPGTPYGARGSKSVPISPASSRPHVPSSRRVSVRSGASSSKGAVMPCSSQQAAQPAKVRLQVQQDVPDPVTPPESELSEIEEDAASAWTYDDCGEDNDSYIDISVVDISDPPTASAHGLRTVGLNGLTEDGRYDPRSGNVQRIMI